ncbi:lamin tail domain-containing protein [Paenibacillus sp. N1-5-1-14]|uniref:lamin tail domain-containing protein n=1 Tax=Paenibacillus radicibacter TaxID=2972488 RepID=UPI0021597E41|nr:lamin tail domain-containing protein [Paenibacillus radicibacter]MCR8643844.1 lamin tail domain-containing protein [Paenibacillus radicibacter]
MKSQPWRKKLTHALTATFLCGALTFNAYGSVSTAHAASIPELLITELMADTDNYEGYDAFEYIELYNASNHIIDLNGYKVNSGWEQTINKSIVLKPGDTALLWTRRAEIAPITLEAFNSYYYDSYFSKYISDSKMAIIHDVGGLVNGGGTVILKSPSGAVVSKAVYAKADVTLNKSVNFGYPLNGSTDMRKLGGSQEPTPGTVILGQVPEKIKQDNVKPQAPSGVNATSGSGTAVVHWTLNTESDMEQYRIYKNGVLELTVPANQQQVTIYGLTGNKPYTFEVTAVDTSDNESDKSVLQTVIPSHQQISQIQRAVNPMDSKYQALWNISEEGPIIPGLVQDLVPQAVAYYQPQNWMLVVSYMTDGRPTTLSVLDATSGGLVKSVVLNQSNGEPYTGHAGGIAVSSQYGWISSGSSVFKFNLADLVQAADKDEVTFIDRIYVPVNASFTTFADGVLWVGEFYESTSYPTDPTHQQTTRLGGKNYSWIVGYNLDPVTDSNSQLVGGTTNKAVPDYVLSATEKVQSVAVRNDSIILSTSYGRNKDSDLYRYNNPLGESPHFTAQIGNAQVPGWFLDDVSAKTTNGKFTIVPLAEGIMDLGDKLYVILESGANKYRYTTTYVLDRMLKIDLNQLDQP